ncbi:MAG: cupin domain-containing protein [Wenzhouxiangellaceae bacterium]
MQPDLKINADFQQRVVIEPRDYRWIPSPMPGVERMMLDRIGGEVARATSIVRYAPDSHFAAHTHGGGEEYLVLQGTFADEHGEYPQGTYVRNPIGSRHTPRVGADGAMIFVKLHQFELEDREQKVIATAHGVWQNSETIGIMRQALHRFGDELVALERWQPQSSAGPLSCPGGKEMLVLEGCLYDEHQAYPKGSWLRLPAGSQQTPYTKAEGAVLYVKTGHLSTSTHRIQENSE